jgi:translation initiation factor 2D
MERVFPLGATLPEGATLVAPPVPQAPPPAADAAEAIAALSLASEPPPPAAAAAADGEPLPDTSTPEGMDAMLDWCLLRGLVDKVPDGELPIKCEELYSKVLLPARPAGTTVDIKKSGYKKIAKLYSVWEKKGLLTVKAVHKIDNIVAVNRQHAAYVAAAAAASASAAAAGPAAAESAAAPAQGSALIEVDTLYRSSSSLRPIFGDLLSSNKDRLLSELEISAALRKYGEQNGLCPAGSDGKLVLDDTLCSGMYGKKEVESSGSPVPFDDLLARLLSKMSLYTRLRITRAGGAAPEEVLQKNAIKNIRVTAEDRHAGRKHVTRVVGVEAFAIEPEELSSRIQKGYNTSCSVAVLPGKNETAKEVAAQGNLLAEIADMLRKTYGIPERYLEVISKLK